MFLFLFCTHASVEHPLATVVVEYVFHFHFFGKLLPQRITLMKESYGESRTQGTRILFSSVEYYLTVFSVCIAKRFQVKELVLGDGVWRCWAGGIGDFTVTWFQMPPWPAPA
jgi:hypothetical protein